MEATFTRKYYIHEERHLEIRIQRHSIIFSAYALIFGVLYR